jgi:hypothetical protein
VKKIALLLVTLGILAMIIAFYPSVVERPVKDGSGPLAIWIDPAFAAPEYHSPLEWWQTHHMDVVNRGDIEKQDCLTCHEPEKSCNNCHGYVGVDPIVKEVP